MKSALPSASPARRRIPLPAAAAAALLLAGAAIYLPAGVARLAALGLLALPLLCVFFDRPVVVFYAVILILFSNLDLFTTFRLYRVVLSLAVFSLALAAIDGRRLVWHHPVLLVLVAAFSLLLFQSISIARDYDAAIATALKYGKHIITVALALQFVRTPREFRIYIIVLAVAILLNDLGPLVLTVPSRLSSLSLIWDQAVFRYEGFVFEPNAFAMIQLMLLPLLMCLVGIYRRSVPIVILVSMAMLVSVIVLVLSFSRGGFVGLAVLLGLLLVLARKNRGVVAIGLILIVAALSISPAIYWQRIESMISFVQGNRFDFSIYTRIELMKEAVRLGFANPLLGIGVDNFIYALGSALPYRMIVHNTFLQVFAELGIIALAVFVGIIAYNVTLIRSLMRRRDAEAALIGRMLLIQLCAALASAFFIPVTYENFFWFLLAFPALADYCYRGNADGGAAIRSASPEAGSTSSA